MKSIRTAIVCGIAITAATGIAFSQSLPLSGLTAGTAVSGTDLFYDVQSVGIGGVKVTGTQVKTFMSSSPTFTGTVTFPDSATWGAAGVSKFSAQTVTIVGLTSASTQCIHALSTGILSGTGSDCSSAAVGGANTQVQFNNNGALGGDSGFTVVTPGQVTIALGTITTNAKGLSITGTWNSSAVTFDAPLFVNITTTGFHSGSLIADFEAGGTTIFAFGGDPSGPSLDIGSAGSTGNTNFVEHSNGTLWDLFINPSGVLGLFDGTANRHAWTGTTIREASTGAFIFTNTGNAVTGTADTGISRDSANVIDVGNGGVGDKSGTLQGAKLVFTTLTGSPLYLGSGTAAMSITPTINFFGQTNPGANETYAVCAGAGATSLTSGGQMFVDTTTCLASSLLVKHNVAAFNDYGMVKLASLAAPLEARNRLANAPIDIDPITEAMALIPVVATYDTLDDNPQFTLIAQNACQIDERLCERTRDGSVRSFRPNAILTILVAALQKQQKQIEDLQSRLERRK